MEDHVDSADPEESFALNLAAIQLVDKIREDGQLLVSRGLIESFNTDAEYVLSNLDVLQREMIGVVNPSLNLDGYDETHVDTAYDVAFDVLRSLADSRQDGAMSLGSVGEMAIPMAFDAKSVRGVLRKIAKRDDEAFDQAGAEMNVNPMTSPGFGSIKMM
jgi:hypothetical protein